MRFAISVKASGYLAGADFGTLCEPIAQRVPAEEANTHAAGPLRGWISEELLTRYTLQTPATSAAL